MRKFPVVDASYHGLRYRCRPPMLPFPWYGRVIRWIGSAFLALVITMFGAELARTISFSQMFIGVGLVLLGINFAVDVKQHAYNTRYPQLYQEWSDSWLCLACGEATRS